MLALYLVASVIGYGQSFRIETFAGTSDVGDGGSAAAASFQALQGVAIDHLGNLYIADADDHRIRKVTPDGLIETLAGNGIPGFKGDGGPATLSQLNTPYGLAVDRAGNLYVADLQNHRIRMISRDGRITTVAGGGTRQPGSDAEGSPATEAALKTPRNVAVDAQGNIYFSDFDGHRVFKVGAYGSLITVAGTGNTGVRGDGGPAERADLSHPTGLAVDVAGTVYIADSGNHRIRKVANGVIATLGTPGGPLIFGGPTGLSLDSQGNLYVADPQFEQVLKVTPAGTVSAIASESRDVAADPAGTLYVAGLNYIRKVTPAGDTVIVAGNPYLDDYGDGGPAISARFDRPGALALDINGNLLIADESANRIRAVSPSGEISTIATTVLAPEGVATDLFGSVFISDSGNGAIRRVSGKSWSTVAGGKDVTAPGPLVTDEYGNLYVSDASTHRVMRISPTGSITIIAGTGSRGNAGDSGLANLAELNAPAGLALDSKGDLYIADSGNQRIRKVTAAGIITTVASDLSFPVSVAVDSSGTIFVSDAGLHAVRMISGKDSTVIAGTGSPGFGGDGGPAASAQLNRPAGIALDADGNLYVSDSGNRRIRKLTPTANEPPPLLSASVVNAASYLVAPVSPGEIVSLFGTGIGPIESIGAKLGPNGALETQLGDVTVLFDGVRAPLLHASGNQLNVVVPYGVAGKASTLIEVAHGGVVRAQMTAIVAGASPGLFTTGSQAIAVHPDGSLNSQSNPIRRGAILTLYATGEGVRNPAAVDGRPADTLARPVLPVSLRIAGYDAEILYAGAAPGFVGLMQINVRVPAGFTPAGEQPLVLQVGTSESQPGVSLWLK